MGGRKEREHRDELKINVITWFIEGGLELLVIFFITSNSSPPSANHVTMLIFNSSRCSPSLSFLPYPPPFHQTTNGPQQSCEADKRPKRRFNCRLGLSFGICSPFW